jgi:2-polyprenyl-3-methyl-5-hydroxy-6-metoxy-1,4-benzoquinol methylase
VRVRPDDRIRQNLPESFTDDNIAEMAIPSYFHRNPFVRYIITERLCEIIRVGGFCDSDAVLDFGTGTGILLPELSRRVHTVIGTDLRTGLARRMLHLHGCPNARIVEIEEFRDLPAKSISKIVAADVLEHVSNLDEAIDKFSSLFKPGGELIVSGPTENLFYRLCRRIAGFSGHYHVRSVFDIERRLEQKKYRLRARHVLPRFLPFKLFVVLVFEAPL